MQAEPNADLLYFNGYCPACCLKGKQETLQLNSNDSWECIICHLQLTTFAPYAAILRWRGEGQFRETEDFAHNHYDKLILTGTSQEPGNNIFPNPREVFFDKMDLEGYLECIYGSEADYHTDQFEPNDPKLQKQEQYLETIATEEWVDLVELYEEVKSEGMHSDSFHAFHQKLYEQYLLWTALKFRLVKCKITKPFSILKYLGWVSTDPFAQIITYGLVKTSNKTYEFATYIHPCWIVFCITLKEWNSGMNS